MSTFLSVFAALILAKICEEIYKRYLENRVKKTFDIVDKHKEKFKEAISNKNE